MLPWLHTPLSPVGRREVLFRYYALRHAAKIHESPLPETPRRLSAIGV